MGQRRLSVAVVGDGRAEDGSVEYVFARTLGQLAVDAGYRIITGGRGGVMEAACRGAHESSSYEPGITVGILPSDDAAEANPYVDVPLPTGLQHGRNVLVARADAVVGVGGQAGTLSELTFAWLHDRLVLAATIADTASGLLAGRSFDKPRFDRITDDRIFAVVDPLAAMQVIVERAGRYAEERRHKVRHGGR